MTRYTEQRPKRTPPYISLRDVRHTMGLTLDQVILRIAEETGRTYTRGTLSAVELGHRGASQQVLDDLGFALGLSTGAVTTDYKPRAASEGDEDAA